jgi:hypothetical protein
MKEMIAFDPSEAIRSSAILELAERFFHVVERIDYGGTLLHLLLGDIAGNFRAENRRDVRAIRAICALEHHMLRWKVLPSDFAMVVARRDRQEARAVQ